MASDLTFQQLAAQLPAGAVTASGGDVVISISALTGDAVTDLTSEGVIEYMYKTIQACNAAQDAVNETAAEGEALAAFGAGSFSSLQQQADGSYATEINNTVSFIIPLDPSVVKGPQG